MKTLHVKIPPVPSRSYACYIDDGLLQDPITVQRIANYGQAIVMITDHHVKKRYAEDFAKRLRQHGCQVWLLSFPAGEKSKSQKTKQKLEQKMLSHHLDRQTLCLAVGGGVVGDMAGFIAATYQRGIAYIQIPTTLLAMVDSSVGGKTAIDTPQGKNLIGCFWQPQAVFADIACLKTLSIRQYNAGLVEAIKMFLTHDVRSFRYAAKNLPRILQRDPAALKQIIYRAIKIKASVVRTDEKEQNYRQVLNFGHTIGHALEHLSHYRLLHGHAVGLGILVEAKVAELLGRLPSDHYVMILAMLAKLGITPYALQSFTVQKIIEATKADKKNKAGKVYYVLLEKLGKVYSEKNVYAHPVADKVIKQALVELLK